MANDPTLHAHYAFLNNDTDAKAIIANTPLYGAVFSGRNRRPDPVDNDKAVVWTDVALGAPDQLRQRVAWALAQLYVANPGEKAPTESALSYYDIFVRHAFGNLRNVLREVTYHPQMGQYLTYHDNRALDASGTHPDENYARELMQLFTVGPWQLRPDGTPLTDAQGEMVPTFDTDDIVDFARSWTGGPRPPCPHAYRLARISARVEACAYKHTQAHHHQNRHRCRTLSMSLGHDCRRLSARCGASQSRGTPRQL